MGRAIVHPYKKYVCFLVLIFMGAAECSSQIEIAIKYSSADCASCQIQVPALLKKYPQIPFYCKASDELELRKLLSNFPDIVESSKLRIKSIESGSPIDIDRKSALVINDIQEKRPIFYKPLNEIGKEDYTLLHLFYTDLSINPIVLSNGKVKGKKKDVYFDEIIELTPQKLALFQHNGNVHLFDMHRKQVVSSHNVLSEETSQKIFLSLYGKQYLDSLQKDETIQGVLQFFPNSITEIKRVRGKFYGIFKFLHVQNFKDQTVDYGFALLTFSDDLSSITDFSALDISLNSILPYGVSYTEKEEWLFVNYGKEENEHFIFSRMDVDRPNLFEPYFPLLLELDSFQHENRGIFLGNSTYLNGYVGYGLLPLISNREQLFDFRYLVETINVPKKLVDPPMEINGYVVDDNTFVQVTLEENADELHSIFRYNDFLFRLRFKKSTMDPLGLSRVYIPEGKSCTLSDKTTIIINPETWEFFMIRQ